MIIGITGKLQNGKDTVAKMITALYKDYEIIHYADPLKDICKRYLGLTENDVNTSEGKTRYNEFWGMTNREILQKVGTDAFRNGFANNFWVKLMELKFKTGNNYIISDVRFDNEAQLILNNNGIIISVNRDSVNEDRKELKHDSEHGIDENLITFSIDNNGTLADLQDNLIKGLNKHNICLS